jgi:hypothetical protein
VGFFLASFSLVTMSSDSNLAGGIEKRGPVVCPSEKEPAGYRSISF